MSVRTKLILKCRKERIGTYETKRVKVLESESTGSLGTTSFIVCNSVSVTVYLDTLTYEILSRPLKPRYSHHLPKSVGSTS